MLQTQIINNHQTCAREKTSFEPRVKDIVGRTLRYVFGAR